MECNSLGLVLQLSRLVGMAPYVRGTYYNVSRVIDIYGKIILTLTSTVALIASFHYIYFIQKTALMTGDMIHAWSGLFILLIVLIGALTAAGRVTRISEIVKQLEQIDFNVSRRRNLAKQKMNFAALILYLTATFIERLSRVFYVIFIYRQNKISSLIHVEEQIVTILEVQIAMLAARVLLTLETINQNLEDLIPGRYSFSIPHIKPTVPRNAWENKGNIKANTSTNKFNRNIYRKNLDSHCNDDNILNSPHENDALMIRRLGKHYINICEIMRAITKENGFLMILVLVYHMLYLELSWHRIIIWVTSFERTLTFPVVMSVVRAIMNTIALIICTEPFHQTHVQMDRTHLAINYLKCRRGDEDEVSNELEMFLRVISLNKTTYSPLSVCTLGRPLVVKIFGSLVTYLVIILTYGPEMRQPDPAVANHQA